MREPTDAEVEAFKAFVVETYGCVLVGKDDNDLMELAAKFLESLGILDGKDFLENYATTIGIYIFIPKKYTGWRLIELLGHECQHVWQYKTYGVAYLWLDVVDGAQRARFEAAGYRVQFDLEWWRYHRVDLDGWRVFQHSYGLDAEDLAVMDRLLVVHHGAAVRGLRGTPVSRRILGYLDDHLSEIRA